jgi:hypothetical protein
MYVGGDRQFLKQIFKKLSSFLQVECWLDCKYLHQEVSYGPGLSVIQNFVS